MEPCPICGEAIEYSSLGSRDASSVNCPRCGNYHITRTVLANLRKTNLSDRKRANISGWLIENRIFEITTGNFDWLVEIPTPSFHEKADKILLKLEQKTEFAGQYLNRDVSWISFGWCINEDELDEILGYLDSSKRIHKLIKDNQQDIYKIIANGWVHLENIKMARTDTNQ